MTEVITPYPKQVIVVRKDLKMNHGKMAAQVAHASMGALLKFAIQGRVGNQDDRSPAMIIPLPHESAIRAWLTEAFTKVCLRVDSQEEILAVYKECQMAGVPCALITDAGKTTFHGVPTITCLGIGPLWSTHMDQLVGHLKLY